MNALALTAAALASVVTLAAPRAEAATSPWREDGFFVLASEDGAFSLKLDGRVFLDFGFHTAADGLTSAADLRRARLAVKTRLWGDWRAKWDIDVANGAVEVKDMWAAYDLSPDAAIKVGHYKVPFSLEELTSSRILPTLERSLVNALAPSRRLALGGAFRGRWWHVQGVLFGQEAAKPEETTKSEGFGAALRLTAAPVADELAVVHLGVAAVVRTPDDGGDQVRFKTRPETTVMRFAYLDTGAIQGVALTTLLGAEAAVRYGPVSLQGELMMARVGRRGSRSDVTLSGFYVLAAWLVTGEVRPYDAGEGKLAALGPLAHGAVELTFRYSHLDLNDVAPADPVDRVTGGVGHQISAGVTWYFNPNARWMLGYGWADNSADADGAGSLPEGLDRRFHLVTTRLAVGF